MILDSLIDHVEVYDLRLLKEKRDFSLGQFLKKAESRILAKTGNSIHCLLGINAFSLLNSEMLELQNALWDKLPSRSFNNSENQCQYYTITATAEFKLDSNDVVVIPIRALHILAIGAKRKKDEWEEQ